MGSAWAILGIMHILWARVRVCSYCWIHMAVLCWFWSGQMVMGILMGWTWRGPCNLTVHVHWASSSMWGHQGHRPLAKSFWSPHGHYVLPKWVNLSRLLVVWFSYGMKMGSHYTCVGMPVWVDVGKSFTTSWVLFVLAHTGFVRALPGQQVCGWRLAHMVHVDEIVSLST